MKAQYLQYCLLFPLFSSGELKPNSQTLLSESVCVYSLLRMGRRLQLLCQMMAALISLKKMMKFWSLVLAEEVTLLVIFLECDLRLWRLLMYHFLLFLKRRRNVLDLNDAVTTINLCKLFQYILSGFLWCYNLFPKIYESSKSLHLCAVQLVLVYIITILLLV